MRPMLRISRHEENITRTLLHAGHFQCFIQHFVEDSRIQFLALFYRHVHIPDPRGLRSRLVRRLVTARENPVQPP